MSIGMIDTTNRCVRPNTELERLVDFGSLENTNLIFHPDGTVPQTVEYMKQIVRKHHKDVAKITGKLHNLKLSRFLRNVFDFVMTYVKYEKLTAIGWCNYKRLCKKQVLEIFKVLGYSDGYEHYE